MRLVIFLALILFLALGALFGALNPGQVGYDLGAVSLTLPKGVAILLALLSGWLLGGLTAWVGTRRPGGRSRRRGRTRQSGRNA